MASALSIAGEKRLKIATADDDDDGFYPESRLLALPPEILEGHIGACMDILTATTFFGKTSGFIRARYYTPSNVFAHGRQLCMQVRYHPTAGLYMEKPLSPLAQQAMEGPASCPCHVHLCIKAEPTAYPLPRAFRTLTLEELITSANNWYRLPHFLAGCPEFSKVPKISFRHNLSAPPSSGLPYMSAEFDAKEIHLEYVAPPDRPPYDERHATVPQGPIVHPLPVSIERDCPAWHLQSSH